MKCLALFDFDGTITKKDSLLDFIKFSVGKFNYYFGLLILSPLLVAFFLKLVPNNIAKEKFISHFFKGWDNIRFQNSAKKYSITQIDKIVRVKAIERIKWHIERGHKVVIVSASIESWLKGWCQNYDLELLSTKLEVKNEKITGKFLTKNCYGIEKVKRIKEVYNLKDFKVIYAYGDSEGDKEMLSIADEKFYKYF